MRRPAAAGLLALLAGCTAPPASMRVEDPVMQAVLADLDGQVPCVSTEFAALDRTALQRFMPGMQFSSEGHDLPEALSYRIEAAATAATRGDAPAPVEAEAPFTDRLRCGFDALGQGEQVARLSRPAIAGDIAFVEAHGAGSASWYVLDRSSGSWAIVARAANYVL